MTGSGADAIPDRAMMIDFDVPAGVPVVQGIGVVQQLGSFASIFGSRVLVVCGEHGAQQSGALAQIEASLRAADCEVELLEGVPSEPGVAVVDAGARLAKMWRADVVVAVGGGSVIDAAKALAAGARMNGTFRRYLSGIRQADDVIVDALPVVAIPTLPGAGSETNGTSVITDEASGRKLSSHAAVCAPRLSLIDPTFALNVTSDLLGPGFADALCHAIEAALSSRSNTASDALAEQSIRILLRDSEAALSGDIEALGRCWHATNLAGQALSLAGSLPTHPIAHALGSQLRRRHARAVVSIEHAVLARFADQWGDALPQLASWMGSKLSGENAALRGVLGKLAKFSKEMHCTDSVVDLGLDAELLDEIVHDAMASGSRGLRSVPDFDLTADAIYEVLDLAISCGPTASTKAVMAELELVTGPSQSS